MPDEQGEDARHAAVLGQVAMTIIDSTMMAPTDRSMPAVRMTRVWPTARAGHDRGLLEQDAHRVGGQERRRRDEERDERDQQQEQRAQPRVCRAAGAAPSAGGVLPPSELGGSGVDSVVVLMVSCPSRSWRPRQR